MTAKTEIFLPNLEKKSSESESLFFSFYAFLLLSLVVPKKNGLLDYI